MRHGENRERGKEEVLGEDRRCRNIGRKWLRAKNIENASHGDKGQAGKLKV